jgi:hypothetical protein
MNNRRKLLSALTALTLASAAPAPGQAAEGKTTTGADETQLAQAPGVLVQLTPELVDRFRWCLDDKEGLLVDTTTDGLVRLDARTLSCLEQLQAANPLQVQQAEIY